MKNKNLLQLTLKIVSVILIVGSIIFAYIGFDKINNYDNSEYSSTTTNAYVGGDAYNYIINGTYFTGYMIASGSCFIGGIILLSSNFIIQEIKNSKEKSHITNNESNKELPPLE